MLIPGSLLQNRYQIICLLGQGGMGAVYQANDLRLRRVVAVKENVGGDPQQFQQEALLLANLTHPNLPRVMDHFDLGTAQYLVMDFIAGEDLDTVIARQGALPEAQVLVWFDQILDAVAYLHARGIIHRDIKPANIKITPQGQAVLVDFGIAKMYQPGRLTQTGARAATPGFASPEQYRGGTDARSDVYSLGATLYALLTGQTPPDALALAGRSAMLMPPRSLNPAISAQTEQAILRAMNVDVAQRFQSTNEMQHSLMQNQSAPTLASSQMYGGNVTGKSTNWIAVAMLSIGVTFVGVAILVGGYFILSGNQTAQATRTPTRVAVQPTQPAATITIARPTDVPTPLLAPTLVVTATITTTVSSPTPTRRPVTAVTKPTTVPTKPGPTATPPPPPGVYVTKVESDPANPDFDTLVGFKVTIFNNSGQFKQYDWRVKIYNCPDQGACVIDDLRKSMGETKSVKGDIVDGRTVLVAPASWKGTRFMCKYIAVPHYTDPDTGQLLPFMTTAGRAMYYEFILCR